MRPPPTPIFVRFDTHPGLGLGRPYMTDQDGNFRCSTCDALLMRKARECDGCKARKRAEKRSKRQHGRHRCRRPQPVDGYSPGKCSSDLRPPIGLRTPAPSRAGRNEGP